MPPQPTIWPWHPRASHRSMLFSCVEFSGDMFRHPLSLTGSMVSPSCGTGSVIQRCALPHTQYIILYYIYMCVCVYVYVCGATGTGTLGLKRCVTVLSSTMQVYRPYGNLLPLVAATAPVPSTVRPHHHTLSRKHALSTFFPRVLLTSSFCGGGVGITTRPCECLRCPMPSSTGSPCRSCSSVRHTPRFLPLFIPSLSQG